MRKILWAVALGILASTTFSSAQFEQSLALPENVSTGLWFVQFSSPPVIEGSSLAALAAEEEAFHLAASSAGITYTRGRSFRELWNGITIRASSLDVTKVRMIQGVRAVKALGDPDNPAHVEHWSSPNVMIARP